MTGPQLATIATILWAILTTAVLIVFGTWSARGSWTILPGLVRGVRDWAAEHAASRQPVSPSPWAVTSDAPTTPPATRISSLPGEPAPDELAEVEELGTRTLR